MLTRCASSWPVVHETQAGQGQGEDGGRSAPLRTESGGRARLIVVLDESNESPLKLEAGAQVGANRFCIAAPASDRRAACRRCSRSRAAGAGIRDPSRPRRRTQTPDVSPSRLGSPRSRSRRGEDRNLHPTSARTLRGSRAWPYRSGRRRTASAIRNEHVGDCAPSRRGAAVVQLHGIGPAAVIGVAAVREDPAAPRRSHA